MIENILIKNEASFDKIGHSISDLKKINFFDGPNGSGKTTISRVIDNENIYPECNLSWKSGNQLKTLVYNRDFVSRTFNPDEELKGVFTLGEQEDGVIKAIKFAKKDRDDIAKKIVEKNKTLKGEDGNCGKILELETLENEFTEQCWGQLKQKYDDEFKGAFKGLRNDSKKFATHLLGEAEGNDSLLRSLDELEEQAKTVFADYLTKETAIPSIQYSDLLALENDSILPKKIIGKDDVDIAAMIKALENSDWVKQGRSYFEKSNEYCPFCQQKTDAAFAESLEEYFDEAYLNNINAIDTLVTNYETYSATVLLRLVTFLYFYHLLKGSNTETGITEDRVVVFDDPVSSLDSDILFIVSALIKNLFKEIRADSGNIRQVFVLTHNIYFHKEISFKAQQNETFWTIKKGTNSSEIKFHESNPIQNSYELLWNEVKDPNRSNSTIRNTLRRILEHYYKILGSIDLDEIANEFEGQDKFIFRVLLSWIHDGSHSSDDDLYLACDEETIAKYLDVFRNIFEKSNHIGHYNMMMGIADSVPQASNNVHILEASA